MESGKYNKRVELQRRTIARNTFNEPVETFSTITTVWANIKWLTGKEYYTQNQQVTTRIDAEITIRYRTDVTARDRIKYGNRIFDIVSPPVNVEEKNEDLLLRVSEVV